MLVVKVYPFIIKDATIVKQSCPRCFSFHAIIVFNNEISKQDDCSSRPIALMMDQIA